MIPAEDDWEHVLVSDRHQRCDKELDDEIINRVRFCAC